MSFYNRVLDIAKKHKKVAIKINEICNLQGKSMIDVGGGSGLLADYLSEYSNDITILEPSRSMLNKAKAKHKKIVSTIQDFELDMKYDVVVCFDSLHHFSNDHKDSLNQIVLGIEKMLKLGKEIIIVEPNQKSNEGKWIKFQENTLLRINSYFVTKKQFEEILKGHKYTYEEWGNYVIVKIN